MVSRLVEQHSAFTPLCACVVRLPCQSFFVTGLLSWIIPTWALRPLGPLAAPPFARSLLCGHAAPVLTRAQGLTVSVLGSASPCPQQKEKYTWDVIMKCSFCSRLNTMLGICKSVCLIIFSAINFLFLLFRQLCRPMASFLHDPCFSFGPRCSSMSPC